MPTRASSKPVRLARATFRNLTTVVREIQFRVQALEAQSKQHLSATQRETLYQLVQTWGQAHQRVALLSRSGQCTLRLDTLPLFHPRIREVEILLPRYTVFR